VEVQEHLIPELPEMQDHEEMGAAEEMVEV
jgi:hypothetical protein